MVTMSLERKEPSKKKEGLLSKMFGAHQTKPILTPETKKAIVSTAKTAAKQTAKGAGIFGRAAYKGLMRVGENIERSGMFEEYKPSVSQPKRSEYLPKSARYKKTRKPKSRIQELQEMGMI